MNWRANIWLVMVGVVGGVLLQVGQHACATDMIIREPQVLPATSNYTSLGRVDRPFKRVDADRYFRQGVELLPGGSSSSYQAGSLNLTNWSNLPTNILTGMAYLTNFVAQTNEVWVRLTNYTQTLPIDYASVLGVDTAFYTTYQGLSNVWFSYTPTSNTLLKVEMETSWVNEPLGGFGQDSRSYVWGTWTTPQGYGVICDFRRIGIYGTAMPKPTEVTAALLYYQATGAQEYYYDALGNADAAVSRWSLPIAVKSGTTLYLYQGWELSREVGDPGATNYFVGQVWISTPQITLREAP